ncbi:MAG: M15 family metallopeptidase [Cyclobacteriaceae bacterium]
MKMVFPENIWKPFIIPFCKITTLAIFLLGTISQSKGQDGFVNLEEAIPTIEIELRYFTSDNFVGQKVDGYLSNKCFISREAANALSQVQQELNQSGYGLKVFDAYRPQQSVDHFVRWAKDLNDTSMKSTYYPFVPKSQLFEKGYIASKSGHTRGSTVDLTIIYLKGENKGQEMDMGTSWDYFSPDSWPSSDAVSKTQRQNRMLLQAVMIKHDFKPLKEEWWHFTLKDEPFPDTYFNFPIR